MTSDSRVRVENRILTAGVELTAESSSIELMPPSVVPVDAQLASSAIDDSTTSFTVESNETAHSRSSKTAANQSAMMVQGIRSKWQNSNDEVRPERGTNQKSATPALKTKKRWKGIIILSICMILLPFILFAKDVVLMTIGTVALHYGATPVARTIGLVNFRYNPTCVGVLISWGNMVSVKDPAGALDFYDAAVSAAPRHASAYMNRGRDYLALKRDAEGLADYNKAILLNPNYTLAHSNRSEYYRQRKLYDLAIADATKAIETNGKLNNPYKNYLWYNRGRSYLETKQWQLAVDDFTKSIEQGYTDVWVYIFRAEALNHLNRQTEAARDLARIRQTIPNYGNESTKSGITR